MPRPPSFEHVFWVFHNRWTVRSTHFDADSQHYVLQCDTTVWSNSVVLAIYARTMYLGFKWWNDQISFRARHSKEQNNGVYTQAIMDLKSCCHSQVSGDVVHVPWATKTSSKCCDTYDPYTTHHHHCQRTAALRNGLVNGIIVCGAQTRR